MRKNEAWEFSRGPGKFLGRVGEGFCGEEVEKVVVEVWW